MRRRRRPAVNKLASLRQAITAAAPDLAAKPECFQVFADSGFLAATGAKSLSFELRYIGHILVMDYAGDADSVFIAIVEWARRYQPDLVTNWDQRETGITFEIDVLNNVTVDLSIKVKLTENVVVRVDEDGNRTVEHVDDSADAGQPWALP